MHKELERYITDVDKWKITEDETLMQAELYHQCKLKNIGVFLEQRFSKIGRVDAVLVIKNEIIVIECKYSATSSRYNIYTHQMQRYNKLKVPIIVIDDREDIEEILDILLTNKLIKGIYTYDFNNKILDRHPLKEINENNRILFGEKQREKRSRKRKISENNSNSYRKRNVDIIT